MCGGVKIFCATWRAFMMTMMWEEPDIWIAWLIPHLRANNSTSVDVILISMMKCLLQRVVKRVNMSNGYSVVVFDTGIWDDNDYIQFW